VLATVKDMPNLKKTCLATPRQLPYKGDLFFNNCFKAS
jgi:hypothetical protein